jgi:hypothetical protein
MQSRLLIGASAWLLGALAATGGSMLAVTHLAHGLLGPDTQQLSPAAVRDALAGYQYHGSASAGTAAAGASAARPSGRRVSVASRSAPASSPTIAPAGTLLASRAGSATASCQSGLVRLLYWIPASGYQADDVFGGPAQQVSLVFEGGGVGVRMRVTCQGSVPTVQVSDIPADNSGGRRDE